MGQQEQYFYGSNGLAVVHFPAVEGFALDGKEVAGLQVLAEEKVFRALAVALHEYGPGLSSLLTELRSALDAMLIKDPSSRRVQVRPIPNPAPGPSARPDANRISNRFDPRD